MESWHAHMAGQLRDVLASSYLFSRSIMQCESMEESVLIKSGSLCPAAKSADIIGDKWILFLLRELLLGSTRFNDFQRALPRISPTVLSKRLKKLETDGLVIRKTNLGDKTKEYRLTRCGKELGPIIEQLAFWGLRWARRRICDEDLDVGTFMWDFHRTLNIKELPDGETVLCVQYPELQAYSSWWSILVLLIYAQITRDETLIFI